MGVRTAETDKHNARTCVKQYMNHVRENGICLDALIVRIDHVDLELGEAVVTVGNKETHRPHSKHPHPVAGGPWRLCCVHRELRREHGFEYAWEPDPHIHEVDPRGRDE